jgi:hypothetical protein
MLDRETRGAHGESRAKAIAAEEEEKEDAVDPSVLHRMRPDVQARRAKYARYVKAFSAACTLLSLVALAKHGAARSDPEETAREMAAYIAAHTPEASPVQNTAAEMAGADMRPASRAEQDAGR